MSPWPDVGVPSPLPISMHACSGSLEASGTYVPYPPWQTRFAGSPITVNEGIRIIQIYEKYFFRDENDARARPGPRFLHVGKQPLMGLINIEVPGQIGEQDGGERSKRGPRWADGAGGAVVGWGDDIRSALMWMRADELFNLNVLGGAFQWEAVRERTWTLGRFEYLESYEGHNFRLVFHWSITKEAKPRKDRRAPGRDSLVSSVDHLLWSSGLEGLLNCWLMQELGMKRSNKSDIPLGARGYLLYGFAGVAQDLRVMRRRVKARRLQTVIIRRLLRGWDQRARRPSPRDVSYDVELIVKKKKGKDKEKRKDAKGNEEEVGKSD
ncbi:hypothetical protein C8F04DRAFT_1232966 [Mycena alexandri]|uniref:Uncharacterized protein n=1 Tax=Mycena alexandri TaxID=1745969 RepID=A0AAD6T0C3_9AGAR|nr:hypothetical protein C8F04DRAFT_1232966 [Mycena alexandri]